MRGHHTNLLYTTTCPSAEPSSLRECLRTWHVKVLAGRAFKTYELPRAMTTRPQQKAGDENRIANARLCHLTASSIRKDSKRIIWNEVSGWGRGGEGAVDYYVKAGGSLSSTRFVANTFTTANIVDSADKPQRSVAHYSALAVPTAPGQGGGGQGRGGGLITSGGVALL